MSLAARASFVSDSESQIYEARGELDPSDPSLDSSPHPQSSTSPYPKGKSPLPIEKRLELIQRKLLDLDEEFEAVTHIAVHTMEDPVAEMKELTQTANGMAKAIGTQGVDWMYGAGIARLLAAAIAGGMSAEKEVTCEVCASLPAAAEDVSTLTKKAEGRIAALEAATGTWQPSFGFLSVSQSLNSCRKTLSKLDSAQIAAIDDLAENIATELDVVNYRREMLFGDDPDHLVIGQLYDLLMDLNRVQPALPLLVTRLNDLKKVHEEGGEFKQRLDEVAERLKTAEEKLGNTGIEQLITNWKCFKDGLEASLRDLHSNA